MKSRFEYLLLMAFTLMLCACGRKDYIATVRDMLSANMDECIAIDRDSTLSDEDKINKFEASYISLCENIEDVAREALRKHDNDSVAVYMVGVLYEMDICSSEDLLKIIDGLGPEARSDEVISRYRQELSKPELAAEGTMFLDFSVMQPGGKIKKLSDYVGKGKYCLVDFWASWCGPCRAEIPYLKEVYEKYGEDDLVMVSVAVWDKPDDSKAVARELGISWNQIVDAKSEPTDLYGIEGIPYIILFGPDGTIVKKDLRGKQIMKAVSSLL